MPTLIYKNDRFDCTTAIKGDDYIHLLDADGIMTSAFDGITNFSDFTLENGSYTSPTADHNCYLAVIRDDGTIGKGNHTCADVGNASNHNHDGVYAPMTIFGEEELTEGEASTYPEGTLYFVVEGA